MTWPVICILSILKSLYSSVFPTFKIFFFSVCTEEKNEILKTGIIHLYCRLEYFLRSEEFGEDLRNELHAFLPNYISVLEKRRHDMVKNDHGIVIAGM